MTVTRADFLRLLPGAVGGEPFRLEGDAIVAGDATRGWRIRLEERPGRPFGPVSLPVLAVGLQMHGMPDAGARAFMDRFIMGYQRAGG
jgi:hypothetical protein